MPTHHGYGLWVLTLRVSRRQHTQKRLRRTDLGLHATTASYLTRVKRHSQESLSVDSAGITQSLWKASAESRFKHEAIGDGGLRSDEHGGIGSKPQPSHTQLSPGAARLGWSHQNVQSDLNGQVRVRPRVFPRVGPMASVATLQRSTPGHAGADSSPNTPYAVCTEQRLRLDLQMGEWLKPGQCEDLLEGGSRAGWTGERGG